MSGVLLADDNVFGRSQDPLLSLLFFSIISSHPSYEEKNKRKTEMKGERKPYEKP